MYQDYLIDMELAVTVCYSSLTVHDNVDKKNGENIAQNSINRNIYGYESKCGIILTERIKARQT